MKAILRILSIFLLVISGAASAGIMLVVSVPTGQVVEGDTFTASVDIVDSADLFGYQFDFLFDPKLVSVSGVSEGTFLSNGGTTSFIGGDIDNQLGTIAFSANTLLGAVAGVDGSGSLLTLQLKALAPGLASFSVANALLLDSSLNLLDFASDEATIQIAEREPVAVSEPSALLLMLPFALALAGTDWRRAGKARSRLRVGVVS